MSTITTRSVKGSPLTNNEVDANFTNLNSDKLETLTSTDGSVTVSGTGSTRDLSVAVAGATTNVLVQIRNATGVTLTKGTVVYISGATGQIPTVSKALATSDATSAQTLGMITADLANNTNGYVTITGLLTNINTSAFTDGQQLYLSGTTAGTFTSTKPSAPIHLVYVGVVEHAHPSQGKIFVKVQNGYELDEIHDVAISSPTDKQVLEFDAATSLWKNGGKYVPITDGSATGLKVTAGKEAYVAVASSNIDLALANFFSRTITTATTFTLSNVPASGTVASFIFEITNGGIATVTWWSGIKWASGTAPTLTASGYDVLGFYSRDGGVSWNGFVLGKGMA